MKELEKYLLEIRTDIEIEQDLIPTFFETQEDFENWHFYEGALHAIDMVLKFVKEKNNERN